jgi:hypothetical protein
MTTKCNSVLELCRDGNHSLNVFKNLLILYTTKLEIVSLCNLIFEDFVRFRFVPSLLFETHPLSIG